MRDAEAVQVRNEQLAVLAVGAPQEDDELVAVCTVHGAVGESLADHAAGAADVLVARLVAVYVVDVLDAVDVSDGEGKRFARAEGYLGVDLRFLVDKGVLAFDAGEGIGGVLLLDDAEGRLACLGLVAHDAVVVHEHGEGQAEEQDDEARLLALTCGKNSICRSAMPIPSVSPLWA